MYTRNAFNRLFMLVISFVSFGFGIIVLLLLAGWIGPAQVSPNGTTFFNQWNYFAQVRTTHPLLDILVGGICAFAGLVILIWELLPLSASRRGEPVRV
jgi:glycerol uptake facilitator-like aquaporin